MDLRGSRAGGGGSRKAGIDPGALSILPGLPPAPQSTQSCPKTRPCLAECPRGRHQTTAGTQRCQRDKGGVSPPKNLSLSGAQG